MKAGEPVFHYLGMPVRLAGRRPSGMVLVESLLRDNHAPQGNWREVDPAKLQNARLSGTHLQQLIDVLPVVAFVTDHKPATDDTYWWQKL